MKNYFLGIVAIVLAVGFSAFTKAPKVGKDTQKYFRYIDYPNDDNIDVASHYELSEDLGCSEGLHRCAVVAESNEGSPERPILSDPDKDIKQKN